MTDASTIPQNIKPINTDTVHKICSGQVVLSLAVAVKELVENSLDAGATNIDVRFKNYGTELIEVSDNGSGVTDDNFAALTLKYHTSKLSDYSDLLGVTSFGFRGEALSSLCALSNLIITTRHKSASYATKLEYDNKGNIIKKTPCSRQIGTTVSLSNLFASLPVRQKEFHKNVKREFNKMTQLLYAYCLISLGVKITCTNQTSANSKTTVVATQGSMSYKDNIACIFGLKQLQTILEIKPEYPTNIKENIFKGLSQDTQEVEEQTIEDIEIDLSEDSNDVNDDENKDSQETVCSQKSQGYKNFIQPIEFTGFISSCAHGSGRSSSDRQFYFVNCRPCEPTKVIKIINEIYRQYNPNQYPFVFLNVNIERTSVDVNVTPDKRKVFLTKEKIILEVLKNSLLKLFENIPRTLKVESYTNCYNKNVADDVKPDTDQPRIFNSFLKKFSSKSKSVTETFQSDNTLERHDLKRKSSTMLDFISSKSIKKCDNDSNNKSTPNQKNLEFNELKESIQETNSESDDVISLKAEIDDNETILEERIDLSESIVYTNNSKQISAVDTLIKREEMEELPNLTEKKIMYLEFSDKLPDTQIRTIEEIIPVKSHTIICKPKNTYQNPHSSDSGNIVKKKKTEVVTDKEDLGKYNRKTINLKTSLEQIRQLASIYQESKQKTVPDRIKFRSAINPVHNKKCEEELSKEILKESFREMIIVGQFNLGFIITRLEDDLFIIDQHATDEIYNFETLQKTTEITTQKLVVSQQLELTGVNEQILMDNLEIFKKNGFTFEIDEAAPPTKRVKLLSLPMSKNWIFGKEDIEELLFMLRESSSEYCRPSRVRAMFASRACRKSVMIGTALSKADMKKLVVHMSEIDKPWNCPHGRPTIRHLVNLAMVHTKDSAE